MLTPKQVNFFKPLVDELRNRKHDVLCTTRRYREVEGLAKIRNFKLLAVGEHGGESLYGKLYASARRVEKLSGIIDRLRPDSLVSLSSPEASRVAFGLGIRHIGFCDAPFAEAVCRLSIPLMTLLMYPSVIPAREFTKYGIHSRQMIPYKALDPVVWLRNGIKQVYKGSDLGLDSSKKTILFRLEESQAAYLRGVDRSLSFRMLRSLVDSYDDCNIVVLSRYADQIRALKDEFAGRAIVIEDVIDGTSMLTLSDLFVGSGGTMNCEASLMGIPNMTYTEQNTYVNRFLFRKGLSYLCTSPNTMSRLAGKLLYDARTYRTIKSKSQKVLSQMEDPMKKTIRLLESGK